MLYRKNNRMASVNAKPGANVEQLPVLHVKKQLLNGFGRNDCAGQQRSILRDHHDAVLNRPVRMLDIGAAGEGLNHDTLAQAGILIDDGALDEAV